MNEVWQQVVTSCATLAAGAISAYVLIHRSRGETKAATIHAANDQVDSIFSVYGQIVSDLRNEVNRLKTELDDLREEQLACEGRNANLETLVTELVARVKCLEGE